MSNRRPCQFFLRGSCRFGDNCRDYHPNGSMFEQGMGSNSSGNKTSITSGFGTSVGQFNPFSGSAVKSSGDMNNVFASGGVSGSGVGPFSNYGGPFGGSESSPFGGKGPFGGAGQSPFGGVGSGGGVPVSGTGTTFGSTPFGSSPFGSGSSPFGTGGGSVFGSSPFGSGSGIASGSASTLASSSSASGKPAKSDNPVLQTLELIGVVVNSGVWPFGRIGLLNQSQDLSQTQTQAFLSLDLSIEEYRWRFYQSDPSNWNNLHLETLRLLTQQYNAFIEQGKMQSKLPVSHHLYNLDFSLYSKIGNWYLPNLGKDFVNKPSNSGGTLESMANPFGGSTIGLSQGTGAGTGTALGNINSTSSPFGVIEGGSSISFGASNTPFSTSNNAPSNPFGSSNMVSSVFGTTNTSTQQPFGGNNSASMNPVFSNVNNIFGSKASTNNSSTTGTSSISSNLPNNSNVFGNTTSQLSLNSNGANSKYSYSNPDVNDDNNVFNCQNLKDWELNAFKASAFEENKIPEKIPPKYLRMYS
ncbi:CCCH like finger domain-containing nucleoporin [Cryptosporidium ubiquitum]|uniref:CCCH like finger domain-containing nucleoporin n=1 Tax=Cryptosporidium ubiquitum TaxID=857276 RepID=A0A1J4MH46_9CRYT|nr:CCCH like finger domain-containing nucleoporin [Cryptosporidium ubiquitum]OII73586.1 CCCH like finger domain-containing nucleoporin [Cryptosporidium ubiquitum]